MGFHLPTKERSWRVDLGSRIGLFNYRIHAKDYETLPDNSQAFIHITMMHLLLKRIAKRKRF